MPFHGQKEKEKLSPCLPICQMVRVKRNRLSMFELEGIGTQTGKRRKPELKDTSSSSALPTGVGVRPFLPDEATLIDQDGYSFFPPHQRSPIFISMPWTSPENPNKKEAEGSVRLVNKPSCNSHRSSGRESMTTSWAQIKMETRGKNLSSVSFI